MHMVRTFSILVKWGSDNSDTRLNERMTQWIEDLEDQNLTVDIVDTKLTSSQIGRE